MTTKIKSVQTVNGKTIHLDVEKCKVTPQYKEYSKFIDRVILDWNDIYVPYEDRGKTTNVIRAGGNVDPHRVSEIADDVETNGIRYEEPTIPVYKSERIDDTGKNYKYELGNVGNHRHGGLYQTLKLESWIFDVYEKPSSINNEIIGWDSNDTKSNVKGLKSQDMINSINRLYSEGYWGNLDLKEEKVVERFQNVLDEFITKHSSTNRKSREKIIKQVIHKHQPEVDHKEYLSGQAETFVENSVGVMTRGKLDKKSGEYNWVVGEGYEKSKILKAISLWNESKRSSNFYMHTEQPLASSRTRNTTYLKRRSMHDNFYEFLNEIENFVLYKQKTGNWPLNIKGFLPQDAVHGEDMKEMIDVDEALKQPKKVSSN